MDPNRQFRAAEGWLELGDVAAAAEELRYLPPALASSIESCRLWVRIHTVRKVWSSVETTCETLLKQAPGDHFAIRHQAEAFHRQGRSREAFAALQHGPLSLKHGADYWYAMARYLCAIDQNRFALTCMDRALDVDSGLKMKALTDPELEKIWVSLQED